MHARLLGEGQARLMPTSSPIREKGRAGSRSVAVDLVTNLHQALKTKPVLSPGNSGATDEMGNEGGGRAGGWKPLWEGPQQGCSKAVTLFCFSAPQLTASSGLCGPSAKWC